jgi:hypothetical protein
MMGVVCVPILSWLLSCVNSLLATSSNQPPSLPQQDLTSHLKSPQPGAHLELVAELHTSDVECAYAKQCTLRVTAQQPTLSWLLSCVNSLSCSITSTTSACSSGIMITQINTLRQQVIAHAPHMLAGTPSTWRL